MPHSFFLGNLLEIVGKFMYLGSVIREDGGMTNETDIRIVKARMAYTNLESLWQRCDISLAVYNRVYNPWVRAFLLHACEN